ncbi:hypothetical protein IW138_006553, partial [Coemansia sp. RSA 986]
VPPTGRQSFGEEQFRGCYREAPFSSIMAEAMIMAIFMALALAEAGPQETLEIETDSRAAIGALEALRRRDPKRPWRSSSMAALLEWGSIWFEGYWDSVKPTWAKGHPGNLHNAEADRLVGGAHGNEQLAWHPGQYLSGDAGMASRPPGKPGSLIKKVECAEVDEHLLAQVRVANLQEQIEQGDVKDTMAPSTWFLAGKGTFHAKNLVRKTTERGISERSLGYKLLLGNILAMKREAA